MFRLAVNCLLPRILCPFSYRLFNNVIYTVLVRLVNIELVKSRKEAAVALFVLPHQNLHVEEIAGETLAVQPISRTTFDPETLRLQVESCTILTNCYE